MKSINKKLANLIYNMTRQSVYILNKESIIKSFMKDYRGSMRYAVEYYLRGSIITRIKILKTINKIDRKIGLYKKENSIYECLKK